MYRSDEGYGSKGRLRVGGFFVALVWGAFLVRIIFGIGPMHDPQGNQASATRYLVGAVTITLVVAVWIGGMAWRASKDRQ